MQINNYTRPPVEQEELTLNIFMDEYTHRDDFLSCFNTIHYENRGANIYEYIDFGNLPSTVNYASDLYDITKVSQKEARNALWDLSEESSSSDWKALHTIQQRMRQFIEQYNYSAEIGYDWKDALIDALDQDNTIKEAANDEVDVIRNCENAKENYHVFSSCGYCQGDYALVMVNIKEMEKLSGMGFDDKFKQGLQKTINHLLWDDPIYATLEIGDALLSLVEYLSDSYVYDKEEIIEGARNDKNYDYPEYVIKFLEDNLTDHLDY